MRDPRELFFSIALEDVLEAARLLRPEFDRSGGRDGFISFECTPDLAHDTEATIAQADELWRRLGEPNVMIKVPGTEAGLPAIKELTRRGININVTLLFSIDRYEQVIDAYIQGLNARAGGGEAHRRNHLRGIILPLADRCEGRSRTAGRLTAARHRRARQCARGLPPLPEAFSAERWTRLESLGAKRQRPLWASTGTKNAAYPDLLYVSELIGPDVVNTMPEATLHAFADHGIVSRTLDADPAEARRTLSNAATAGVDLTAITTELEREGVNAFCDSYHQLLACLTSKLAVVGTIRL